MPYYSLGPYLSINFTGQLSKISRLDLDLSVSQNMVCPVSSLLSHSYSLLVLTLVQLLVTSTIPEVGGILDKPIRGQY